MLSLQSLSRSAFAVFSRCYKLANLICIWMLLSLLDHNVEGRPIKELKNGDDVHVHLRKLLNEETESEESTLGTAFVVGVTVGLFGILLIVVSIGILLFCNRHGRASEDHPKSLTENFELVPTRTKERTHSDGRISFIRSASCQEPSFRGIESLELDKIEVGASLGRGAFGKVYKGEFAGIPLAIKVFEHDGTVLRQGNEPWETYLSRNTDHPNVVKTLVNETRRRGSFHETESVGSMMRSPTMHPSQSTSELKLSSTSEESDDEFSYIARAMGTADSDDSYRTWVVMEYCDMGSLDQAIKNKTFFAGGTPKAPNMHFMLLTACDIARAMEYLHQQRIVHGDLKSQNVLLKKSDRDQRGFTCKVGDFGLSRVIINKTHIDTFTHGTVSHSAPELFKQGLLTPAADVYSFGILLWELFTGEKAYTGIQHNGIIMAVTRGMRPLVPSHCPQPLALLINDCWNDSYLRRPSFKTILERLSAMIRDCNSLDIASSLTWSTKLNQVSLKTESGLNVSPQEDINNKHPTRIITTEISNVNGNANSNHIRRRIEAVTVSTQDRSHPMRQGDATVDSSSESSASSDIERDLEEETAVQANSVAPGEVADISQAALQRSRSSHDSGICLPNLLQ